MPPIWGQADKTYPVFAAAIKAIGADLAVLCVSGVGLWAYLQDEEVNELFRSQMPDELRDALKDSGFARTTVERIARELDDCDAARFSPVGASREEMREALDKVRDILREIEKTPLASDQEEAA